MSIYKKIDGCYHSGDFTQIFLKVKQVEILIPHTFMPIEKGEVACYEIKGLEGCADNNFYIVDCWGKKVYKARNYKNDWTAEGLKQGTYYYLLMLKEFEKSNWQAFKGYISIIKEEIR